MSKNSPLAVFDSGVGSYSIVKVLHKMLPSEKIIYLADRASFPYGQKTHSELKTIVDRTISWLETNYQPKLIIVASNTPSIQVLDEIKTSHKTPLIGVFPPIEQAVKISNTKHIAILATKGAVISSELDDFIKSKNLPINAVVHKVNASDMVALIEPGIFQSDYEKSEQIIKSVIDPLLNNDPKMDIMTLSSTHLPFLNDFFKKFYPNITFLDPAEEIAHKVKNMLEENNLKADEKGEIQVLATIDADKKLKTEELKQILFRLGLNAAVREVIIK